MLSKESGPDFNTLVVFSKKVRTYKIIIFKILGTFSTDSKCINKCTIIIPQRSTVATVNLEDVSLCDECGWGIADPQ